MMEAFLVSTGIVTLAEMGDKTQLLSLVLAARHRKPWPLIAGIFVATVLNHALAGYVGVWLNSAIGPNVMRWILGVSFIAMAGWMLIPDKLDEEETLHGSKAWGVFAIAAWTFFLAEMGDKTQVATIALGAQYDSLVAVVLGTTLGMMLANVPVVFLGEAITKRVPIRLVHMIAAGIFLVLGLVTLFGVSF